MVGRILLPFCLLSYWQSYLLRKTLAASLYYLIFIMNSSMKDGRS